MRFLLSIHDVWPGNFPLVEGHLQRLQALGAGRAALLVVPEYHGRQSLGAAPEFIAWLREKAAAGSEILLHGCHHLMSERLPGATAAGGRSAWGRFVNRRVHDEAEFCGLPAAEREALLERGLGVLAAAGFPPGGFVAPTWHGGPPVTALAARGIVLRETRFYLHHLPSGRKRFVPPLAFDAPGRHAGLVGGRPWLAACLRLPLIKVALHPGDFESQAAVRTVEQVIAQGRGTAYGEIFASPPAD